MSSAAQIFLTGVTGFVGKVVLEELLRRRTELNLERVYVLIRPKRGSASIQERFEREVASSACFSALPPNWQQTVTVVPGDLSHDGLGIEPASRDALSQRLTHIINCAASVEFDLPLADAAAANITSALNVLELAGNCPGLRQFVNVSTAYVTPHPGEGVPVPEELVKLPFDPEEVYRQILEGTADQAALLAQTGHPNTYTLTKCISENLLAGRKGNVPLAIVRPSIISASWQYPMPGWIDSYAAFAGFVSLIGAGLIKCVSARENTILDLVPCDEVSTRIVQTAFWSEQAGPCPLVQHVVTGLDRGGRVDTCIHGIESFFQRNPVRAWPQMRRVGNGKPIHVQHWLYHKLPSQLISTWFALRRQPKQQRQVEKMLSKIEYLDGAFPYFTHNSFAFEAKTPIGIPNFEPKQYIERVCRGVYENLMRNDTGETPLAGAQHRHPKRDWPWARQQPQGNWAIRTAAYVVRKGLRRCTDTVTFNRPSFEQAVTRVEPGSLMLVVPNHRSYMDFVLCSYLFFAHPDLQVPIPQIAAANEFAKIPLLGWFFRQTHAFYIQRGLGKADPELTQKIENLVEQNQTLEFFIEGSRSRARQFLKPRRGLLRALQQTGIPCTILPIAISYDLVPEEKAFLTELRTTAKPGMSLSGLLRWTARMLAGKVKLGRVHIVCGEPVRLDSRTDVHAAGLAVMHELQAKTAVSTFHLKAFLDRHPLPEIDLEGLSQLIQDRGGDLIHSPLQNVAVDPLTERTLRYQWKHLFYADLLACQPGNAVLDLHVRSNSFGQQTPQASSADIEPRLVALLRALFEPVLKDYALVMDLAAKTEGHFEGEAARALVRSNDCFLPFVEEALSVLCQEQILTARENGYSPGPRWSALSELASNCVWTDNLVLEAKLA